MTMYPFFSLFLSTLFISTIMALMSNQWMLIWIALELNMISFIPIINSSNWNQEQEACLKYLLFQALGSSILLLSCTNSLLSTLLPMALLIKLGAAPFHFWFPSIMKSISWTPSILLMTWQKIAPMCLLIFCMSTNNILPLMGGLSALVGGIGGMNQTHFRPLLAYSSIGHMGWIIAGINYSPLTASFYLMSYLFLSSAIMMTATLTNTFLLKGSSKKLSGVLFFSLSVLLLSLSGLPPFTGFIPKLLLLSSMKSLLLVVVLILGSLLNLFYYLNFILIIYTNSFTHSHSVSAFSPIYSLLIYISLCPLPFISCVLLFL